MQAFLWACQFDSSIERLEHVEEHEPSFEHVEGWRGCVHPGCRLRASGICPIPCVHPLLKSLLRASVKMAFLVVRIGNQKDPCVRPFQK